MGWFCMLNFVWTWLWDWVCLSLLSPASKTCGCCIVALKWLYMSVPTCLKVQIVRRFSRVVQSSSYSEGAISGMCFYVQKQGSFIFLNFMTGDLNLEERCRGAGEGERKQHPLVGRERIPFNWQLFWKEFTGGGEGMGDKKMSGGSW